jgi:hypothetical protein
MSPSLLSTARVYISTHILYNYFKKRGFLGGINSVGSTDFDNIPKGVWRSLLVGAVRLVEKSSLQWSIPGAESRQFKRVNTKNEEKTFPR